jgi:hypothetical protein
MNQRDDRCYCFSKDLDLFILRNRYERVCVFLYALFSFFKKKDNTKLRLNAMNIFLDISEHTENEKFHFFFFGFLFLSLTIVKNSIELIQRQYKHFYNKDHNMIYR